MSVQKFKEGDVCPVNYYYVRNKNNQPVACVALIDLDGHKIAKGVSVCSKKDRFSKSTARKLAFHRLSLAVKNEKSEEFGEYTGRHPHHPEDYGRPELQFKMAFGVNPSDYEWRILHKPEQ